MSSALSSQPVEQVAHRRQLRVEVLGPLAALAEAVKRHQDVCAHRRFEEGGEERIGACRPEVEAQTRLDPEPGRYAGGLGRGVRQSGRRRRKPGQLRLARLVIRALNASSIRNLYGNRQEQLTRLVPFSGKSSVSSKKDLVLVLSLPERKVDRPDQTPRSSRIKSRQWQTPGKKRPEDLVLP